MYTIQLIKNNVKKTANYSGILEVMQVLILTGGSSNEREVSLRSAKNTEAALTKAGHETTVIDISDKFILEDELKRIDVVLPIIHGAGGEDGKIQTELEKHGAKFLGSGSQASAVAFDKIAFKERMAEHGILTPNWQIVDRDTFVSSGLKNKPYVLKPIKGGSSIDTFIVHNPGHQVSNFDETFKKYGQLLLEELIIGQEITVSVLDKTALPVILIIPPEGEEFDYDNKYNGKSQELVEPDILSPKIAKEAKALAEKVHQLTELEHISRTDMIISPDGAIYTLETNTMPGLTEQSLFPKAAEATGMSMPDLVEKLIKLI